MWVVEVDCQGAYATWTLPWQDHFCPECWERRRGAVQSCSDGMAVVRNITTSNRRSAYRPSRTRLKVLRLRKHHDSWVDVRRGHAYCVYSSEEYTSSGFYASGCYRSWITSPFTSGTDTALRMSELLDHRSWKKLLQCYQKGRYCSFSQRSTSHYPTLIMVSNTRSTAARVPYAKLALWHSHTHDMSDLVYLRLRARYVRYHPSYYRPKTVSLIQCTE